MKRKSTILSGLMALALLFSLGFAKEAKAASDLGFSFDVLMADGGQLIDGKPSCTLYSKEGKEVGTLSVDGSILTFTTNQGTLVVQDDSSIALPTADGTMALGAGEITHIVSATGAMKSVTSIIHRCLYEIDANGNPTKCINCLYALIRE